ncbi:hypothetical protein MP228_000629 [Amoeboaphelidium protococcarum]|nr:hypothetical protein MP228_000629 [Amoeboaphelidium protococcarum]
MKNLLAVVTFKSNTSGMLDPFVSFSRQAAQAFKIPVSKTIYPIDKTLTRPHSLTPDGQSADIYPHNIPSAIISGDKDQQPHASSAAARYENTEDVSYQTRSYIVNRSPFVHGRHQDTFHIRTYHRQLALFRSDNEASAQVDAVPGGKNQNLKADSQVVSKWLHYISMQMPAGIGMDYELIDHEPYLLHVNQSQQSQNEKQQNVLEQ